MKDFFNAHFEVFMLLGIFLLLIGAHSFMVHAGRPADMIQWCEGMITGVFTAMVALLSAKKP